MKQLRIHYLQHVAFEGLGYIETWVQINNHSVAVTKLYESYTLPQINDFDWLIVMGGPMGVYDTDTYSWMREEKAFIKLAIDSDKVVVGICLGANVYPNVQKEIGWFPIQKTTNAHSISKDLPESFISFHWHGDTFDLPKNAVHILQTDVCPNQAFVFNLSST